MRAMTSEQCVVVNLEFGFVKRDPQDRRGTGGGHPKLALFLFLCTPESSICLVHCRHLVNA